MKTVLLFTFAAFAQASERPSAEAAGKHLDGCSDAPLEGPIVTVAVELLYLILDHGGWSSLNFMSRTCKNWHGLLKSASTQQLIEQTYWAECDKENEERNAAAISSLSPHVARPLLGTPRPTEAIEKIAKIVTFESNESVFALLEPFLSGLNHLESLRFENAFWQSYNRVQAPEIQRKQAALTHVLPSTMIFSPSGSLCFWNCSKETIKTIIRPFLLACTRQMLHRMLAGNLDNSVHWRMLFKWSPLLEVKVAKSLTLTRMGAQIMHLACRSTDTKLFETYAKKMDQFAVKMQQLLGTVPPADNLISVLLDTPRLCLEAFDAIFDSSIIDESQIYRVYWSLLDSYPVLEGPMRDTTLVMNILFKAVVFRKSDLSLEQILFLKRNRRHCQGHSLCNAYLELCTSGQIDAETTEYIFAEILKDATKHDLLGMLDARYNLSGPGRIADSLTTVNSVILFANALSNSIFSSNEVAQKVLNELHQALDDSDLQAQWRRIFAAYGWKPSYLFRFAIPFHFTGISSPVTLLQTSLTPEQVQVVEQTFFGLE